MTAKIITMNGKAMTVKDIVAISQVGAHTYEFRQAGREGKLRVTEVTDIMIFDNCNCHQGVTV